MFHIDANAVYSFDDLGPKLEAEGLSLRWLMDEVRPPKLSRNTVMGRDLLESLRDHAKRRAASKATVQPARRRPGRRRKVKTDVLRAYVMHLHKSKGLSRASLHYRMVPIKMTSRVWFENEPDVYRDVGRPVRLPKDDTNPLELAERERRKALSPDDLGSLIAYLAEEKRHLHPVALLQCYCGLRVLEALNVRECDVDVVVETLTVTATEKHKPKTRDSYRTIPIPSTVAATCWEHTTNRLKSSGCGPEYCPQWRNGATPMQQPGSPAFPPLP